MKENLRILLIYPTITTYGKDTTTPQVQPPLGLLYIAAVCERQGYDVKVLDCIAQGINHKTKMEDDGIRFGLKDNQITEFVIEYKPDIIGISSMFSAFSKDAHNIARISKEQYKKIPIIFGGMHASALPGEVLNDINADFVVIGEGEETIIELCDAIIQKKDFSKIKGIAYKDENNKILINEKRSRIKKLDDLPFPARHLIDISYYSKIAENEPDNYIMEHPYTVIYSSRGCPNNCIYCAAHNIWCNRWISRSSINVVNEIEYLIETYGIKEIHFLDDNFSVDRKRIVDICDEILKRKLNISWTCPTGVAIWTLDEELLKLMKKSGCYKLCFGIESAHPNTLKFIKKNLDLEKTKYLIKYAARLGYWLQSTYIIGFPYETKEEIETTINYAIHSYSDFVNFLLLIPYPGTEIFDILVKEKLLNNQNYNYQNLGYLLSGFHNIIGNKYLTSQELNVYYNNAFKKLLLLRFIRIFINPFLYFRKIYSKKSLKYFIRVFINFIKVIKIIFYRRVTEEGSLKPNYTNKYLNQFKK